MTKDEALKMCLEYIETNAQGSKFAILIKEALAQPEQEPVGKFAKFTDGIWREVTDGSAGVLLYTTPQRTWVGLTEQEQLDIFAVSIAKKRSEHDHYKAIEARLKDKNT